MKNHLSEKDPFLVKLGRRLKAARVTMNLTQATIAASCKCDKASLCRIEAGKTNITVLTLKRLADVLQIPVSDLFKDI